MAVNIRLTRLQWALIVVFAVLVLSPYAIGPMASNPSTYFLALPMWFWAACGVGVVFYIAIIAFIKFPSAGLTTNEGSIEGGEE